MGHDPPSSGVLILVCVATGGEIDTGVFYEATDLQRVEAAKLLLACPSCHTQHLFHFSDARLRPLTKRIT